VKAISKSPTNKGENAMTRSILNFAATVFAAILPFTAATANAQGPQSLGTVKVPFAFEVGSQHMQPGTYNISLFNQHAMLVRGTTTNIGVAAIGLARWNDDGKSSTSTKVVFHHYGVKYFLREVWDQNQGRHLESAQTPAETKMRKAQNLNVAANGSIAPAVEVVVAASQN
jgi:hypothetical protein